MYTKQRRVSGAGDKVNLWVFTCSTTDGSCPGRGSDEEEPRPFARRPPQHRQGFRGPPRGGAAERAARPGGPPAGQAHRGVHRGARGAGPGGPVPGERERGARGVAAAALRQREEVDLEKEADLASAVSLLRLFLQELPEPVIPSGLQAHILQLYQEYSSEEGLARNMKYFLQQLPQLEHRGARRRLGPDVFHLDTDVEDLKEQESVSRILAELLENQEEFFDSDEDDVSTTNDYSSINEQITELLDDEKLEPCEELPQDRDDGPQEGPLQRPKAPRSPPAQDPARHASDDMARPGVLATKKGRERALWETPFPPSDALKGLLEPRERRDLRSGPLRMA
ncbi:hypothetical protein ANANG_G00060620 [Anguilla anguilla]|uniref:Rho-GAP domain-containing protein n=1 Tax=Anguilla anguilla TaxID=7936 RepID=A0A9D3S2H1_ANGAN|nr:hypothetical protein ANANG_G00060620 [Anguilla anguilla]